MLSWTVDRLPTGERERELTPHGGRSVSDWATAAPRRVAATKKDFILAIERDVKVWVGGEGVKVQSSIRCTG